MGQNLFHAGALGAGQIAKMCNNMLLAIHMAGTAEALALGVKEGWIRACSPPSWARARATTGVSSATTPGPG
jgi:3-hydroxyisobutyrate dehydrogenase-like beta-hydroxyacid dehydrogenase